MVNQGNNILFSWPGNAPGLVLEQTDALESENAVWTTVSDTPTLQDGNWTVQKPIDASARFYRLRMK